MDSINKNQPEPNHEDLNGAEAVAKVKAIVKDEQSCFFVTSLNAGESEGARPMSVQRVDDDGSLWFLSAVDSYKNREIAKNPAVALYFQRSSHSGFLRLNGMAAITQDKPTIKSLWEPIAKVWFTGGVDDPRITAICVTPSDGYYWDNKHGGAVAGAKMLVGAMIGKTLDDSIEGAMAF